MSNIFGKKISQYRRLIRQSSRSYINNSSFFDGGKRVSGRCTCLSGRFILLAVVLWFAGQVAARADACNSLQTQSSGSGRGSEIAALNRQLAALGNVRRQRKCSGHDSGGFFNACADIASRIAEAKRQLQIVSASIQEDTRSQQKLLGRDCRKANEPRGYARKNVEVRNPPAQQGNRKYSPATILFCVRLSDGYRFPAPKSQFSAERDAQATLDICRYICEDNAMGVYAPSRSSLESADLVAVDTGTKYSDLKTADAYQSSPSFKVCNFQRYYDRVNEARASTVTPYNMANVAVPVPAPRPSPSPATEWPNNTAPDAGNNKPEGTSRRKKVRLVGEAFLPVYSIEGSLSEPVVPTVGADSSMAPPVGENIEVEKWKNTTN